MVLISVNFNKNYLRKMDKKYLSNPFSLLLVLGLSAVSITNAFPTTKEDKQYISLDDLYASGGKFSQTTFNGTWISETEILYRHNGSNIYIFDAENGETNLFISESAVLDTLNTTSVTLSNNKRSLLARSDPEQVFRHSSIARYAIYDIDTAEVVRIANHERLQFCEFYGEGDGSVVFVLDNDLYVKNGLHAEEIKITNDGIPGVIYNGIPDWVYEEEVLSSGSAVWFSPSFTKLAFASFNDTLVEEASYLTYAEPDETEEQYPVVNTLRYPKVGRTNPTVTLRVTNLENGTAVTVDVPTPVDEVTDDHVLYTVSWISETELAVVWTNRRQNKSVTVICDPEAFTCETELIREEPEGWIEVYTPRFSNDGLTYLDIGPVTPQGHESWDQWYHLVKYTKGGDPNKEPTAASFGRKTVSSIVGWNQDADIIYYIATRESVPWEVHLFKVTGNTETCLSCEVTLPGGDRCTYATAWAPKGATFYALACEAYGNPAVTTIYNSNDSPIFTWQDNENLRELISGYWMPQQMLLQHPVPMSNASIQMFLPPQLDVNDPNTKYSMVVDIYTGPNSARINDRYGVGYQNYMSTNRSIIYCRIDGRGTGRKGKHSLFSINNALGTYEVDDILNVTSDLVEMFQWIDKERIGLWGWSYGGYATALAITKDETEIFRCGISVAPVISWMYYDTIYTERYMGLPTPEDNLEGYERGDVSRRAELMRNRRWLLIHGNADDNVHFQNAMLMARALQLLDIQFDIMTYPNEAHGLSGTLMHVYHTIDKYWTTCFTFE